MNATREEWRAIPGWEGAYEVSSLGRVRSVDRIVECGNGPRRYPSRVLKACSNGREWRYLHVALAGTNRYVHQLVLEAFVGPRPEGDTHARHLNDDPHDNRVENLAWGTRSENYYDSIRNGLHFNASKTHCKRGHEFNAANTRISTNTSGGPARSCRACQRERNERKKGMVA